MMWTAALYLTASPRNGSSSPMWVLAVLHAASAAHPNARMTARLKDMAVIVLESGGPEQRPDDRQRAEQRHLADRVLEVLPEQTRKRKTLAVAKFDDGLGPARLQAGYGQVVDHDRG